MNKPGVSERDIENIAVEEMIQLPLIFTGAKLGTEILGGVGRVVGAGAGAATGSAARDLAAGVDVDMLNACVVCRGSLVALRR